MAPSVQEILRLPSLKAARELLGCILIRQTPKGTVKLKIVETEAYHQDDPASHSFRGMTARTAPMFEAGGRLYIYFTYGMHYCINIVTGRAGRGEAVLLRAAEPLKGVEIMQKNRGIKDVHNLTNGPAKLTQALGIKDTSLSGRLLNSDKEMLNLLSISNRTSKPSNYSNIWLEKPDEPVNSKSIVAGPRIGIREATDMPWRFYIKDNPFVSK